MPNDISAHFETKVLSLLLYWKWRQGFNSDKRCSIPWTLYLLKYNNTFLLKPVKVLENFLSVAINVVQLFTSDSVAAVLVLTSASFCYVDVCYSVTFFWWIKSGGRIMYYLHRRILAAVT